MPDSNRRDINRLNISKGSRLRKGSRREALSAPGTASDMRTSHTESSGMVLQARSAGGDYYSIPLFDLNNPNPKTPAITRAGETIKITADNVLIPNDLTVAGIIKGARQETETGLSITALGLDIRGDVMIGAREDTNNYIVFNKSLADHLADGSNLAYIQYRSDEKSINFHTESNETFTIDSGGSTLYTNLSIGIGGNAKDLAVFGTLKGKAGTTYDYTITNLTERKNLDCNTTSLSVVADVLGSLITDLIDIGLLT